MSDCLPAPRAYLIRNWTMKGGGGDGYDAHALRWGPDWVFVKDPRHGRYLRWTYPSANFALSIPAPRVVDSNPVGVPRVLVCYLHRPTCVGLNVANGFRLAGALVRTAGPFSPHAWGHVSAEADIVRPTYTLEDREYAIKELVELTEADGFRVDVIVAVDANDDFHVSGAPWQGEPKFVHIASENWDDRALSRYQARLADLEFWCIRHWQDGKIEGAVTVVRPRTEPQPALPERVQHFVWAADIVQRPFLPLRRDKWVSQIGVPYDPRPTVWNHLRAAFDGAPGLTSDQYNIAGEPFETEHTIFGVARTNATMANVYARSEIVLSSSNQDFVPNRVADAFATGAVLLSDDTPSLREDFGPPWPESAGGIWVAHDKTPEMIEATVRRLIGEDRMHMEGVRLRAFAAAHSQHTFTHRARDIMTQLKFPVAYVIATEA